MSQISSYSWPTGPRFDLNAITKTVGYRKPSEALIAEISDS